MTPLSAAPPDLAGTRILVVEDEFYLAMDIKEGIENAGGAVVGPFPDPQAGLAALAGEPPDCAVIDINLGHGPSFEIADALQRRHVPFLFLTGYDAPMIPPQLAEVERVEKPAEMARIVEAIARLRTA